MTMTREHVEALLQGWTNLTAQRRWEIAPDLARNWNRDQVAIALDNPGGLHRLTFGDFLDLHAALQHKDDTHGPE